MLFCQRRWATVVLLYGGKAKSHNDLMLLTSLSSCSFFFFVFCFPPPPFGWDFNSCLPCSAFCLVLLPWARARKEHSESSPVLGMWEFEISNAISVCVGKYITLSLGGGSPLDCRFKFQHCLKMLIAAQTRGGGSRLEFCSNYCSPEAPAYTGSLNICTVPMPAIFSLG